MYICIQTLVQSLTKQYKHLIHNTRMIDTHNNEMLISSARSRSPNYQGLLAKHLVAVLS